ncbi:hypothetical protein ACFSTC_05155 [Nonomuraea ferruginea]
MNRGWMVAGVLALVAAPVVPAAAAGVAMVLERVDDPAGMVRWIRTGDVLRYEVRLSGMAEDASLAVAATPVHSLTGLSCARHVPPPDTPDPGGAEITARALAARALTAPDGVAVPGAQACHLGDVSSEKAVQVVLSVPSGAEEVEVAAVARLREGDGGLTTILRTATTSVADESSTMNGPAAPVPDPWDESRDPRAVEEREFGRWEAGERARRETWQEWPGDRRRMRAAERRAGPSTGRTGRPGDLSGGLAGRGRRVTARVTWPSLVTCVTARVTWPSLVACVTVKVSVARPSSVERVTPGRRVSPGAGKMARPGEVRGRSAGRCLTTSRRVLPRAWAARRSRIERIWPG